MLFKKTTFSLILAGFFLLTLPAQSADVPKKVTAQVVSGLYVTASEAWDMMEKDKKVILIDVRDPIEIMFTGFTNETDIHVPFILSNRTMKHPKKAIYGMTQNPDFLKQVEAKLVALNVSKDTAIIVMCRSGSTRSGPAADMLYAQGWKKAYTMVDGFEGSKSKTGPSKGVRDVNGWRNSGLPWGYKLNFDKMYMADK